MFITEELSDEDDLKSIIDDTIAAFDRENFINKGFLSKAAAAQCKYLVSPKCCIYFRKIN